MRAVVLGFLALLIVAALPAHAVAKTRTLAPPGNAGIGQYVEVVPTASGGQPTITIHHRTGARGGAVPPGGGSSGGGTGGGGGVSGGGGGVSAATAQALASDGPDGAAAATLARATMPAIHRVGHDKAGSATPGQAGGVSPRSSPVSSVFNALTGSSASGGLGPILPIVLVAGLLGGGLILLLRRRTT